MATARNVRTAGGMFFINFAHRVKVHNTMFLVYTKLNALSYGYKLLFFLGGPIALHGLVRFLDTTGPSLTKVVYPYFDRISHTYVYIYIYIYIYIFINIHKLYIYIIMYIYLCMYVELSPPIHTTQSCHHEKRRKPRL